MILPALHQAVLDAAMADQLFADLAAYAELLELRWKGGPAQRTAEPAARTGAAALALPSGSCTPPTPGQLAEARTLLATGDVRCVQIRYALAVPGSDRSEVWCDTLIASPQGLRLTRISEADIARSVAHSPG